MTLRLVLKIFWNRKNWSGIWFSPCSQIVPLLSIKFFIRRPLIELSQTWKRQGRLALQLSALLFVRPGELRRAEWAEIDLAANVWRIPTSKMKTRQEHAVPLSSQAVAHFNEAKMLSVGGRYVFPSIRSPLTPMSENTVNAALRRLGFTGDEMTAHGFRAMASTLLNESNKWSPDAIERALAHKDKDTIRAAYHRGAHWAERVAMAQWWADYLDRLRHGAEA